MSTNETYTGWTQVPSAGTRSMIRDAAEEMGGLVRSTLGPFGLDKMIVRRMPDDELRGFVSNNGIAIVEEFEGETDHPVAKRFIGAAEDHETEYGDGSTTMVLLAAELTATAMDLVDRGVHPVDVVEGFSVAAQRTLERWEAAAVPLSDAGGALDRDLLREVALTGMVNGRPGSWPLADLAETVVEAVLRVSDPATGSVRLDHAETVAVPGGSVADSTLVEGVLLPKPVVTGEHRLPATGGVLLVDGDLQARTLSRDVRIDLDSAAAAGRTTEALVDSEGIAAAIAASGRRGPGLFGPPVPSRAYGVGVH
jgi:chaperonin GroEL (HSP60 family)